MSRARIYACVLLPAIAAVIAAVAWTAWSSSVDRNRISETASEVGVGNSVAQAQVELGTKLSFLLGLRRVRPDELTGLYLPNLARTGETTTASLGREQTLALLADADRKGALALDQLTAFGYPVPEALRTALAPVPGGARTFVDVRGTAGLPLDDYEQAYAALLSSYSATQTRSASALQDLAGSTKTARWLQPEFLALGVGLLLAIIAAMTAVGWWISRAIRRSDLQRAAEHDRAEALTRRNARLLTLVDAGRRVIAGGDVTEVTKAVAEEAKAILGARAVTVLLLDDDEVAHPIATAGDPAASPVGARQGVVGRAIDTGQSTRAVVSSDPAFPEAGDALSVVVAPLIAGRRVTGAITAVAHDGALADDDDELTLRLISLAAATAIESAKTHDNTAKLADTDALTGLANRRRLDLDLAALNGAINGEVAFIMLDVDHFKAFNDTYGHPAGDALLRRLAEIVTSCVRDSDVVYRFGGEEFAVLLRDADPDEAEAVATRVRSSVAAHPFAGGDTQPGRCVTVSVGVSRGRDGDDATSLLHRADAALYAAKHGGRDRVVLADAV